eukprot:m.430867 g.430867  ORF g.430867 m.430867 type:complete len:110 (+) comp17221_c0_seq1:27-356(+)
MRISGRCETQPFCGVLTLVKREPKAHESISRGKRPVLSGDSGLDLGLFDSVSRNEFFGHPGPPKFSRPALEKYSYCRCYFGFIWLKVEEILSVSALITQQPLEVSGAET